MAKRTTIRLVPPLQESLAQLAAELGVSYNQLINYALTRFIASQEGLAVLETRARRGSRSAFLRALKKADRKKREPRADDTLPADYSRQALIARLKRDQQRATG
jgi:antitoxin component of RelBE/YafQ-DinJ toxin-antitoxin module